MSDHYKRRYGRFEFKRDPQNDMLVGPDGCHHHTERSAMYYGQIGFCGCGDPYSAHEFAIKCLSAFDRDKVGFGPGTGIDVIKALVEADSEQAAYFIAYTLDKCALTEHGGGVGGSWLTDRGRQFLEIGPMGEDDEVDP